MYDFWANLMTLMLIVSGFLIVWWIYYRIRLASGKKFRWPWGKIALISIGIFLICAVASLSTPEPKAEQRADSESSAKVASHKKAVAEKKKAETASTNAKKTYEAKAASKAKQESKAKAESQKKANSESKVKAESQKKAKAKQKKSVKKQQDKEANAAYQKSLTAYCNNTGNANSVKYDGDGGVTFKVDDSTLGDTVADKKALAVELADHANKLADMCDVNEPTVLVYTQSGDPIARTTLGGGIKVYK